MRKHPENKMLFPSQLWIDDIETHTHIYHQKKQLTLVNSSKNICVCILTMCMYNIYTCPTRRFRRLASEMLEEETELFITIDPLTNEKKQLYKNWPSVWIKKKSTETKTQNTYSLFFPLLNMSSIYIYSTIKQIIRTYTYILYLVCASQQWVPLEF